MNERRKHPSAKRREHTVRTDVESEKKRNEGVPSGRCKRRRLKSFAGDMGRR